MFAGAVDARRKAGQKRSRVPLAPSSPDFSQDFLAILGHLVDKSAGRSRFLVLCTPNEQFQEHWRQIDPLFRQAIVHTPAIRFLRFRCDDPRRFELPQTIRQNVRGNSFTGFLELLERSEPSNHHVADN